jgi:hypothetical protein
VKPTCEGNCAASLTQEPQPVGTPRA